MMDSRTVKTTVVITLLMSCFWLPLLAAKEEEKATHDRSKRVVPALVAGYYVTNALWYALLAGTTALGVYTAGELYRAGVKRAPSRRHHRGCSSNFWSCEDAGCYRMGGVCNSVKYKRNGQIRMQCQCLYF